MSRPVASPLVESGKITAAIFLVVAIGFFVTYQFVEPPPPKSVRIATGGKSGAYYAYAQRYAALLAKDGISLEVVATAGSVENLELLRGGKVALAFAQGGSAVTADNESLQSLGSLYLEPVWIFTNKNGAIDRLGELWGKRIAVGPPGSGTRLLAEQVLAADGVTQTNATFIDDGAAEVVAGMREGKIDAGFFVASPQAASIGELLNRPEMTLFNFTRGAAFVHKFPYLSVVSLSEGVLDLERNLPPRDTNLMAVAANLVARQDLNTNLIPALMKAVVQVHRQAGVFEKPGQFPSADLSDLPVSSDARHYITNGPSFLFRWLPYTAAVYLDRLKIMLLPFIALMIPLFRFAPMLYRWHIRSRIYRWYGDVRDIDIQLQESDGGEVAQAAVARLKELEKEVASVSVPLSYTGELYNLRLHIRLLSEKLGGQASRPSGDKQE